MLVGLLIILPLIAAALTYYSGKLSKYVALGFSLVELVLSFVVYATYMADSSSKDLSLNATWIKSIGTNFAVGVDGIGVVLVLLTTVLVPLIILSSYKKENKNSSVFYALILFMQMALIGVFTANDGFLFYVFWELALIPIYFICLGWGDEGRQPITFKFFVYTLLGSLFMLIGFIYIYQHTGEVTDGEKTWAIQSMYDAASSLSLQQQIAVYFLIFVAFAIKIPVIPFHTWQPDTYTVAPTQGTMLLSGIMLKMGIFGLIKWLLPFVPDASILVRPYVLTVVAIGVVYAACMAIVQKDFKRLIAYSSISHVGMIACGVLTMNADGMQGAVVQMVSHGVTAVGLFLIADIINTNAGTREIASLGGIRNVNPSFSVLYLIVLLGAVALPLTSGFVGEFMLLNSVFQYNFYLAAFVGLSVILGAVYMLRSYQGIMLGETNERTASFGKLAGTDVIVLVIVCALIIVLGLIPSFITDISSDTVAGFINIIKK